MRNENELGETKLRPGLPGKLRVPSPPRREGRQPGGTDPAVPAHVGGRPAPGCRGLCPGGPDLGVGTGPRGGDGTPGQGQGRGRDPGAGTRRPRGCGRAGPRAPSRGRGSGTRRCPEASGSILNSSGTFGVGVPPAPGNPGQPSAVRPRSPRPPAPPGARERCEPQIPPEHRPGCTELWVTCLLEILRTHRTVWVGKNLENHLFATADASATISTDDSSSFFFSL